MNIRGMENAWMLLVELVELVGQGKSGSIAIYICLVAVVASSLISS